MMEKLLLVNHRETSRKPMKFPSDIKHITDVDFGFTNKITGEPGVPKFKVSNSGSKTNTTNHSKNNNTFSKKKEEMERHKNRRNEELECNLCFRTLTPNGWGNPMCIACSCVAEVAMHNLYLFSPLFVTSDTVDPSYTEQVCPPLIMTEESANQAKPLTYSN